MRRQIHIHVHGRPGRRVADEARRPEPKPEPRADDQDAKFTYREGDLVVVSQPDEKK